MIKLEVKNKLYIENLELTEKLILSGCTYTSILNTTNHPPLISLSPHYDSIKVVHEDTDQSHNSIGINEYEEEKLYASFALFFKSPNQIKIPPKIERTIKKYVSKKDLRDINKDESIAIELCLLSLSNLTDTFFFPAEKNGWKNLKKSILDEQIDDNHFTTVKKIIDTLIKGTSNGSIIECDNIYKKGVKSMSYRLGQAYRNKGIVKYELKTKFVKDLLTKNYYKRIAKATNNVIAHNLMNTYQFLTLPSIEEIKTEAKRLIKNGYKNKKGKTLTFLNKHSKEYFKDSENRVFVEDSIAVFEYLTEDGLMIPSIGDSKSGGRVVDSFTLMPAWIRHLVKYNGKKIEELDFSALHPNLAMRIYGGSSSFITHEKVAEDLQIDVKEVKKQHLSFFNMRVKQMRDSVIYKYYSTHENKMIMNITQDKYSNGHKVTSQRLFKTEVDIMTEIVKRLNSIGVYVGYLYDALFCPPEKKDVVKQIMNQTILDFGVKTQVK